jgi:hypothetical protein
VNEMSGGKYPHVHHFDGKTAVTAYGRQFGIPSIDIQPGFYATNFKTAMALRKQADRSHELTLPLDPDQILHVIDMASDYGLFVREAIESPAFCTGLRGLSLLRSRVLRFVRQEFRASPPLRLSENIYN